MKWLVQEFLNNALNVNRISNALEKCSVDYLLVRVNKDNTLTVIDKEKRIPLDDSEEVLKSFTSDAKIMIYGSKALAEIATDMKLTPGSFMTEQFEFEVFQKNIGDSLLNNEFIIGELSTLNPTAEEFFIRPTGNTKIFTGMTITKKEFLEWKKREDREGSPYIGQTLMIAPLQRIKAEYRFFVVNQKIITGSSYKVGDKADISCKPSPDIIEYTQRLVDKFPLAKAFVIDIAETESGLKVIEYNNINTSGLYGCNELAFIRSINELQ